MLAPSASTLPPGHLLVEPYVYDVSLQGSFDPAGVRRSAGRADTYGSLAYVLYGVANRFTAGVIPTVGFTRIPGGGSSSSLGLGDVAIPLQFRLTKFEPGRWVPTTSVVLQETLPTGQYDRLSHPGDGQGSGAFTTMLALYSQTYFWPGARILRVRFNVSGGVSSTANVQDSSVYGTPVGFRGQAKPGGYVFADASFEYSLTRRWVLALDATARHDDATRVVGLGPAGGSSLALAPVAFESGPSRAFGLAPAIEYSWKPNLGVLLGTRIIAAGRNTGHTVSPAIAINYVH
jgi:hypothetical protein